jgi:16S rRNA (adenine(1408)-N(1))-methyltransferase
VLADIGTGDGRFVLATATANPRRLVIGIDPVAGALVEASRRAAAPVRKGGLPNALFVAAAAESLPSALHGVAERVTVNLPWGSLLRGALALDEAAAAGIACLVAPGGTAELLLAPAERDRLAGDIAVERRLEGGCLADAWLRHGLCLAEARPATAAELAATPTTWAKRLGLRGSGAPDRTAWRLVLRREPADGGPTRGGILRPCSVDPARTASRRRAS